MAKQRGRPFEPGNKCGRGRPPGSKNKGKSDGVKLLAQYELNLIAKLISMALEGDMRAMKTCISLLLPAGARKVEFPLNETRTIAGISRAFEQLMQAVAKGKLAPGEAESISRALETGSRILEKGDNMRVVGQFAGLE